MFQHNGLAVRTEQLRTVGNRILYTFVKPFLIILNCLIGFIFEFLVELPFLVILGFHHLYSKKRPVE